MTSGAMKRTVPMRVSACASSAFTTRETCAGIVSVCRKLRVSVTHAKVAELHDGETFEVSVDKHVLAL